MTNNTQTNTRFASYQAAGRDLSASIAASRAANQRRMDLWLNLERVTKSLKAKTEPYLCLLIKLEGIPGLSIDRTTAAEEARQVIGCLRTERKGGAQGFTYEAVWAAVTKALPPSKIPPGGLHTEGSLNAAVGAFLDHLKGIHQAIHLPLWLAVASVLQLDGRHNAEAERQITEQALQQRKQEEQAAKKKATQKVPDPVTEEEAKRVLEESTRKALQAARARKQKREEAKKQQQRASAALSEAQQGTPG